MVPIRDVVVFPYTIVAFVIGRPASVRALEAALRSDKTIFLATQHDATIDEPSIDQVYSVGTIARITHNLRLPDGNIKVLVEGVERASATEVNDEDGFFVATVRVSRAELVSTPQTEQLVSRVHQLFEQYNKLQQSLNQESAAAELMRRQPRHRPAR